jgi:hypothetical protein
MSMKPLTVLATGPNAATAEFEPLRAAGLDLVIGRPLDAPDRRPWSEADLIEAVRAADIVLASHLELISRPVLSAAERLQARDRAVHRRRQDRRPGRDGARRARRQ